MGSVLLALQFGITDELLNSIRYLKGWFDTYKKIELKILKMLSSNQKKRRNI